MPTKTDNHLNDTIQFERVCRNITVIADVRKPPNERRRGQFKAGWEDATTRYKCYTAQTLERLTWRNLGYRFGQHLGESTFSRINNAFEWCCCQYPNLAPNKALPKNTLSKTLLPEEVPAAEAFWEGAITRIAVNNYERNSEARQRCIKHYGTRCCACGIELSSVYGSVAKGLIHVHHLQPLSSVGAEYEVDPIADLRPVCPNCHAVIHRRVPPYTIEEIQSFLE